MSENINKKLSKLLEKMDDKVTKSKLEKAINTLKNKDTQQIEKMIKNMDKEEVLKKLEEFNPQKIKDLKIDKAELDKFLRSDDIQKILNNSGKDTKDVFEKIKSILEKS